MSQSGWRASACLKPAGQSSQAVNECRFGINLPGLQAVHGTGRPGSGLPKNPGSHSTQMLRWLAPVVLSQVPGGHGEQVSGCVCAIWSENRPMLHAVQFAMDTAALDAPNVPAGQLLHLNIWLVLEFIPKYPLGQALHLFVPAGVSPPVAKRPLEHVVQFVQVALFSEVHKIPYVPGAQPGQSIAPSSVPAHGRHVLCGPLIFSPRNLPAAQAVLWVGRWVEWVMEVGVGVE